MFLIFSAICEICLLFIFHFLSFWYVSNFFPWVIKGSTKKLFYRSPYPSKAWLFLYLRSLFGLNQTKPSGWVIKKSATSQRNVKIVKGSRTQFFSSFFNVSLATRWLFKKACPRCQSETALKGLQSNEDGLRTVLHCPCFCAR